MQAQILYNLQYL